MASCLSLFALSCGGESENGRILNVLSPRMYSSLIEITGPNLGPTFSLDYLIEILGPNVGATFFSEYRTLRPSVSRNASSKLLSLTQFDSV